MHDLPAVRTILVIDDDEVMRSLLEALLSLEGYRVILADSGEAGTEALAEGLDVDLVLTDLHMPGLEQGALAESLRNALPGGAVLLAMSGSAPDETTLALFDGFLQKPFDGEALRRAAQRARSAGSNAQFRGPASSTATEGHASAPRPVLDRAIFQSLGRLLPAEKLRELYEMTVADIMTRSGRMEAAFAQGDLVTVKREAHATKGSCGMVGAQELQEITARIEDGTMLNTSALAEIPAACQRLRRMLDSQR